LIFSLMFLASPAAARQTGQAPRPGRADPRTVVREGQRREAMLRNTEMLPRSGVKAPDSEAAAEQLKQDFTHIQVLRNNLARHLTAGRPLDYKFIANETKEVNKRANRLRAHLLPLAPGDWAAEPQGAPPLGGEELTDALVTLCRRIDSFTENPVFKVLGVVNVEESVKAAGDLQTIIRLSGKIKDDAARLNKAARR
jgi:hypothetical protein